MKRVEEKIRNEVEKLDPNTQEYEQQTLDYLKSVVEERGDIPSVNEDPSFYEALMVLWETLKSEKARISLKDLAEYLGIDYQKLRKYKSIYRKEREEYGLDEVIKSESSLPDAVPAPQPTRPQPPSRPQKLGSEYSLRGATLRQVEKNMVKTISKKVEDVIREEADLVFRLGKEFYTMWRAKCFSAGYDNLVNCMHDAANFFFEYKDMVEVLESELESCKNSVKYLLMLQKPEIRRALILEKAKKLIAEAGRLPPEEQKMVIDKVLNVLEKLIA